MVDVCSHNEMKLAVERKAQVIIIVAAGSKNESLKRNITDAKVKRITFNNRITQPNRRENWLLLICSIIHRTLMFVAQNMYRF